MKIVSIYAQESLDSITENDIVFFLAGPTCENYNWRNQLVEEVESYIRNNICNKVDKIIYFLIPEGRNGPWSNPNNGNNIVSLENGREEFYDTMINQYGMPPIVVNQIQWETIGLEKGYVVYRGCLI